MSGRRVGLVLAAAVVASACVPVRYADCGGGVVRLADDPASCGGCHVSCPAGAPCIDGTCVVPEGGTVCPELPAEPEGYDAEEDRPAEGCGSSVGAGSPGRRPERCVVVDLAVDPRHCGVCGNVCPGGARCVEGACRCDEGLAPCLVAGAGMDDRYLEVPDAALAERLWSDPELDRRFDRACVAVATDPANCGGCDRICPPDAACLDGSCVCGEGLAFCTFDTIAWPDFVAPGALGACIDLSTAQDSCGTCGAACSDGSACLDGACVPCCGTEPTPPAP